MHQMIDRALVAKIVRFAVQWMAENREKSWTDAVLATVDEFTPTEPAADELEAEMQEIDREYLRMNARQAVHHWLKERWAADRIEWRKHMEANSR